MTFSPERTGKVVFLSNVRLAQYRNLQSRYSQVKRSISLYEYALIGAKLRILSEGRDGATTHQISRFCLHWDKRLAALNERAAGILVKMEAYEKEGTLF